MRASLSVFVLFAFLAGCMGSNTVPSAPANTMGSALGVVAATVPVVGGCNIFPSPPTSGPTGNDWWNTDISKYPLDPNSAAYIAEMGASTTLHPDFGQNPTYGIPFIVVPQSQKLVPVKFGYASSSNPGPYPIPPNAPIEGGSKSNGDRHVLIVQQGLCKLYEMWRAFPKNGGKNWTAGAGAVWPLNSNKLRPNGWTSADAAGLPILPALVKCAEVQAGVINHALRVTFNNTQAGYIHPATHFASSNHNKNVPPMGLRIRLKASFGISHYNRTAQIILTAMKTYGMFVADNGSDWYFQGEGTGNSPKTCWNDNELNQLKNVPGGAFEVVQTGPILH